MKWIAILILSFAMPAGVSGDVQVGFRHHRAPRAGYGIAMPQRRLLPQIQILTPRVQVQVVPVQPVIPQTINVTPMIPQTSLRWGFFQRRLIPSTTYTPGPTMQYQLQQQQPTGQ